MFKRFLFCLPLIASLTAAVAQAPVPAPPVSVLAPQAAPVPTPVTPCDCCAAKPLYRDPAWAPFVGTVAVVTQQRSQPSPLMNQVVVIWDLHIKNGVPLNTWWNPTSTPPTQYYSDPRWTVSNMGDVFGATLDGKGNIYLSATTSYGSANVGSLAAGAPTDKTGQIYKIANFSGQPTPFAQLPNKGAGLGNIYYDCEFDSLYASNFYDGQIYRVNAAGVIQPVTWDHGINLPSATDAAGNPLGRPAITGFDGSSSYAALGRRPWAVRVYKNRLWYSIWNDNLNRNSGIANEIWSVGLDVNGDPASPARLEISLPSLSTSSTRYSNPVSDINFGPLGTMMVAERTMLSNNTPVAHQSRTFEYSFNGSAWVLANPAAYQVGIGGASSAGGVDVDFSPGGRVWASGDGLHLVNSATPPPQCTDCIYGIQGLPQGGGDPTNSILIDDDNNISQQNKSQLGVVRIPCPDCANPPLPPVITGPQSTCVSPSHYSITPQAGVTYTWTVTGGTPSATTGSAININWTGGPGTIKVTTSGPNTCGAVSAFINVAACSTTCEFCGQFQSSLSMTNPVNLGGGLQRVTPLVTSTMTGVRNVTTTLLSTSVGFSPASCGVAGPLASYIPQAQNSSVAALNPPMLPVPNGNQAIWRSSTAVPLSPGGATTPFLLKLPPPPPLSPACSANFSLCLRVSLGTANCQNCDQMQCFGPFPYVAGPALPTGLFGDNLPKLAPLVSPDGISRVAPEGSSPTPPPR